MRKKNCHCQIVGALTSDGMISDRNIQIQGNHKSKSEGCSEGRVWYLYYWKT